MCCWRPCVTGPAVFRSPPASDGLGIKLPSIRKVTGLVRRDRDVSPPRMQQLRDRMYKNKEIMGEVHFLTRAFRVSEGFMMQMTVIGVSRSHSCEPGFTRL